LTKYNNLAVGGVKNSKLVVVASI